MKYAIILFSLALNFLMIPAVAEEQYDAKSISEAEHAKEIDPNKITLRGDTEGEKVNFKVGEEMTFKFSISYGNQPTPEHPYKIKWRRFGDDGKEFDKNYPPVEITSENPVIFKTAAQRPGFVTVRVWLLDSDDKEVKVNNKPLMFTGALGAEIEKLTPLDEPEDFDQFWKDKLAELEEIPMNTEMTPVNSSNPKVAVWKFTIPCLGDSPSTGYLYMPVDAEPKSLPAIAQFKGYGQPENLKINYSLGINNIVIDVSRFGIMQEESKEYYQEQAKKLKGYGFNDNDDRETSYFRNMLLRDYRALQFLKSRPEWNGNDLSISGGSMGGLQSFWMAGLDTSITKANINYPWLCDTGAEIDNRPRSDWAPKYTPALKYYDPIYFARRISPDLSLFMFTGLGDRVCPVTGVTMAYLAAPCKNKQITYQQAATHAPAHKNPQKYKLVSNAEELLNE